MKDTDQLPKQQFNEQLPQRIKLFKYFRALNISNSGNQILNTTLREKPYSFVL